MCPNLFKTNTGSAQKNPENSANIRHFAQVHSFLLSLENTTNEFIIFNFKFSSEQNVIRESDQCVASCLEQIKQLQNEIDICNTNAEATIRY